MDVCDQMVKPISWLWRDTEVFGFWNNESLDEYMYLEASIKDS